MAAEGLVRRIDKLGRIVIPAEFRKSLEIRVGEDIAIILEGDYIKVCKHEDGCVFCGEKISTIMYCGKPVCEECRMVLASK